MAQDTSVFKIVLAATKKAISRKVLQANRGAKDNWPADV